MRLFTNLLLVNKGAIDGGIGKEVRHALWVRFN